METLVISLQKAEPRSPSGPVNMDIQVLPNVFSKELMRDVNESTVRLIKKQYLRELQNSELLCMKRHGEDPLLG